MSRLWSRPVLVTDVYRVIVQILWTFILLVEQNAYQALKVPTGLMCWREYCHGRYSLRLLANDQLKPI
jgi:ABC-type branched-subunit amino acid transport system ATPase component